MIPPSSPILTMGGCLSLCGFRRRAEEYEPLNEERESIVGADRSRLQAFADEDDALLRDPTIQQVLADDSFGEEPLDDDELSRYISELNPQ